MTRFNHSGELDLSFGSDGTAALRVGIHASVEDIAVDAAGRIYVAGNYDDILVDDFGLYVSGFAIVRFLPDGKPDLSFGTSAISKIRLGQQRGDFPSYPEGIKQLFSSPPTNIAGIALQPNGKLLLLTNARALGFDHVDTLVLARFDTNGNIDPTFATNGLALIHLLRWAGPVRWQQ